MTMTGDFYRTGASQNALLDQLGGLATMVIALLGLLGVNGPLMAVMATIVFGATSMVDGGGLLIDLPRLRLHRAPLNVSFVFLSGAAAVVIGVLALLDVGSAVLTPIASIALGSTLILSNDSLTWLRDTSRSREEALDLSNIHVFAGIAVIVLGSLSAGGGANDLDFNLVALFLLGVTNLMTGKVMLAIVQTLLRPRRMVE